MPARRSLSAAVLAAFGAAPLSAVPIGSPAQETLVPGAHSSDCRSALRPGVESCPGAAAAPTSPSPDATFGTAAADAVLHRPGAAPGGADVTEARIDAFLRQYGKPPREAVRALLDPSDDNILAWLQARRRTLEVARYVADRMTTLETGTGGAASGDAAPPARAPDPANMPTPP